MTNQTLLTKALKTQFDGLPNFSGYPSKNIVHFLKAIKNITKANVESDNYVILENVLGKLTQSSAGLSFNNNEYNVKKCSDFEIALRQRYFSITRIHKKP